MKAAGSGAKGEAVLDFGPWPGSNETLLSITGSRWVAGTASFERKSGFGIWIIANLIWVITSLVLEDWAQVVLWTVYLYYAYVGWRNNE